MGVAATQCRAIALQQAIQRVQFHIVGSFPEFEEQLTSLTADHTGPSPDRADASVHLYRLLMGTVEVNYKLPEPVKQSLTSDLLKRRL